MPTLGQSHVCLKCCKATKPPYKKCGRCKRASYCNKECQLEHWPVHKSECRPEMPPLEHDIRYMSPRQGTPPTTHLRDDWSPRGSDTGKIVDAALKVKDPVYIWIQMPAGVTEEKNAMAIKSVAAFNYSIAVDIDPVPVNTKFLFPLPATRPKHCLFCNLQSVNCPVPLQLGCLVNSHAMCHAYNKRTGVLRRRYHGDQATDQTNADTAYKLFREHSERWPK